MKIPCGSAAAGYLGSHALRRTDVGENDRVWYRHVRQGQLLGGPSRRLQKSGDAPMGFGK